MSKLLIILALAVGLTHASPKYDDTVLVCKSKHARAYHRYECKGLRHCTYTVVKMTKAQAIQKGYRACRFCYR